MILEGIVTTLGPDGAVNIAPMGPTVDPAKKRFLLRPFPSSQTYRNLRHHGEGVLHVTDDALLLAKAAVGPVEPPPRLLQAQRVRGSILADACHYYEFRVAAIDAKEQRVHIEADVVHTGRLRDFFGFNRAKHAVVEAAILATRTHLVPLGEIDAEYRKLAMLVEKTGGPEEIEAFALLRRHLEEQRRRQAGAWVRVRAPSRLHFGLLVLPAGDQPAVWPGLDGRETMPARHFGGVGLMVQAPGVQVAAQPSNQWSASGPLAKRALAVAEQFVRRLATLAPEHRAGPCQIVVDNVPSEHCGLGTGTQLSLAVARAILEAHGIAPPLTPTPLPAGERGWGEGVTALAKLVDRGCRSSIGIHGFTGGGLVVEAGHGRRDEPGLLIARQHFPEAWKVLLVMPRGQEGRHGGQEQAFFAGLEKPSELHQTEALCRLVVLGILPAVLEEDLQAFGEALFDFNRRSGEMFRAAQGGTYARAKTQAMVDWLRGQQIRGVGQSSWGPTVFAIVDENQMQWVKAGLAKRFGLDEQEIAGTIAANQGAMVTREPSP
jgi:beta-RFAP synthase